MKFGVSFMGISPRHCAEVAATLDRVGFESLWVPEHMFFPTDMPPTYPYTETGQPPVTSDTPCYDPWVLMGYIACATENIRLANNIFILPLRHPLASARSIVTLDRLSGGRVTLGVGVGWLEEEFVWTGQSFHDRGKRTDEIIPLLRELWTEDVIEHHGEHYDFGPLKFNPKPLQKPGIPIEIGGASKAALRRAGRLGDGWIEIGATSLDDLQAKIAVVEDARREAGREERPFEITTIGAHVSNLDDMRRAADIGATRIIVGPWGTVGRPTPESIAEWAEQFADEVMAKF
jgi:probable F420-dependent oxidoreductase